MSPIPVPRPQASTPPPPTTAAAVELDPRDAARRAYDRAEREAGYAGYRLFGFLDAARPWLVEQAAQAEQRGDLEAVANFGGILRHLDEWRELERVREAALGYALEPYAAGAADVVGGAR
jgi:hypothetical protein